jgi:predicted nuclease with RNAse H fold
VIALGVDVGATRKGLDAVVLDEAMTIMETRRRLEADDVGRLIEEIPPDVVAIDAPPAWGLSPGGSRLTEREIRRFGIQSFGTPSDPKKAENAFYDWMRAGFLVFEVAARHGFGRYRSGPAKGTAIEVFPHATAVVLSGCLQPKGVRKREWRTALLTARGVDADALRSMDQVDAALAALTGLFALRGRFSALGDPREGVIVLPSARLPARPYAPCDAPPKQDGQPHLPGLSPCRCGDPTCGELTGGEFARGHDAKRKALLWRLARTGDEAVRELRRRGWDLPAEMR